MIENELKEKLGSSTRRCCRDLNFSEHFKEKEKTVSRTSIINYLHQTDWGKSSYKMNRSFMLSPVNIDARLNFGKFLVNQGFCGDDQD